MTTRVESLFKPACASVFAALVALALPLAASAQASAPLPAPMAAPVAPPLPASAASAVGPRLLTPSEKRDNADAVSAPDLRPDRPVIPQISVPLGRKPAPVTAPASASPRKGATNPPGQIGDSAARCESLPGDLERATCRKRLAQAKPPG